TIFGLVVLLVDVSIFSTAIPKLCCRLDVVFISSADKVNPRRDIQEFNESFKLFGVIIYVLLYGDSLLLRFLVDLDSMLICSRVEEHRVSHVFIPASQNIGTDNFHSKPNVGITIHIRERG